MSTQRVEFNTGKMPVEVKVRYDFACTLAPSILAIHPNIRRVVLFAGIADGKAKPDSDVDIAALYLLRPYSYRTHEEILQAYRNYKSTLVHTTFPVHFVILPEEDIQQGRYPTSKNIRDKGIVLCQR